VIKLILFHCVVYFSNYLPRATLINNLTIVKIVIKLPLYMLYRMKTDTDKISKVDELREKFLKIYEDHGVDLFRIILRDTRMRMTIKKKLRNSKRTSVMQS
jgi:hypothetical protein